MRGPKPVNRKRNAGYTEMNVLVGIKTGVVGKSS